MARLILPCKGSTLARTSLLGLISSAPVIPQSQFLIYQFFINILGWFECKENLVMKIMEFVTYWVEVSVAIFQAFSFSVKKKPF